MKLITSVILFVYIASVVADVPACQNAKCSHCEVEFIKRMCPKACGPCTAAVPFRAKQRAAPTQQAAQVQPIQQIPQQQFMHQPVVFAAPQQQYQYPVDTSTLAPLIEQPRAEYLNPQLARQPADLAQPLPEYQNIPQNQVPVQPIQPAQAQQQPFYPQTQPQQPQFGQAQLFPDMNLPTLSPPAAQNANAFMNPFQPFLQQTFQNGGFSPLDPLGLLNLGTSSNLAQGAPLAQVSQPIPYNNQPHLQQPFQAQLPTQPQPQQLTQTQSLTQPQLQPQFQQYQQYQQQQQQPSPQQQQPQAQQQALLQQPINYHHQQNTNFNGNYQQVGAAPQQQPQQAFQQPQPSQQTQQSIYQAQQPQLNLPTMGNIQIPQIPQVPPSPPAPININHLGTQYAQQGQQPVAQPNPTQQIQAPVQQQVQPVPQAPVAQQQYATKIENQLPVQTAQSIDRPPVNYQKYIDTGKGPAPGAATAGASQCPRQPGWSPCISKDQANDRFRNCCARLGEGCVPLCNYDATLATMQLAVLTGRCPLNKVADMMICASGYQDATPCCEAYNVFEPGYEHCRPYCNPAAGLPQGGLLSEKYKCLVKLSAIQQCFYVSQKP